MPEPPRCDWFERVGLLRLERGEPVDDHVSSCPDCAELRRRYARIVAALSSLTSLTREKDRLDDSPRGDAGAARESPPRGLRRARLSPSDGALALGAIALLVAGALAHGRSPGVDPSAAYERIAPEAPKSRGSAADPTRDTWVDLSDNGHDGALRDFARDGASGWVGDGTPRDPYALRFSGQHERVQIAPGADGLRFSTELTVVVWASPEPVPSQYATLLSNGLHDFYGGYILAMSNDIYTPKPWVWGGYFCDGDCPYWNDVYSHEPATQRGFQHIALTFSVAAGFSRIYIDGELCDQHPVRSAIWFAPGSVIYLGEREGHSGSPFKGRLAVVRVWSQALAEEEIAAQFQREAPRFGIEAPTPDEQRETKPDVELDAARPGGVLRR
jgi:Concanavalin A-like lectin/glucanases superfamily